MVLLFSNKNNARPRWEIHDIVTDRGVGVRKVTTMMELMQGASSVGSLTQRASRRSYDLLHISPLTNLKSRRCSQQGSSSFSGRESSGK